MKRFALLGAITAACLVIAPSAPPLSSVRSTAQPDLGHWRGFVDDSACASCHGDIARSFSSHSMARSFAKTANAHWTETFAEGEAASFEEGNTRYQFVRSGDGLQYRRWQVGPDGEPIHLWQRAMDWVLGSASNSRVYLVQSEEGALYELPVAWYSQTQEFAPTPGTMEVEREGRLRAILRPCLFCHNAVPADPTFDDHRFAPEFFPHALPEGIGCQRCHGPGRRHIEAARAAARNRPATPEARRDARDSVRVTITNPSKLEPSRRRDVCAQCHHQPAVALFGQRRLDRGDYEFTAGERLADFLLKLDILEESEDGSPRPVHDRFEINHHAYRLEQSACVLESPPGTLECLSCHDPHRDQAREKTFERARGTCLGCHAEPSDLPVEVEPQTFSDSNLGDHLEATDCVTCHMPQRRTEDIVRVVMTDHRIQRRPEPVEERLAPIQEQEPNVLDVFILDPDPSEAEPTDDLIRAMGGIRTGALSLTQDLARLIEQARKEHPQLDLSEPEMRLANALVRLGRDAEALPILERLRRRREYRFVATELAAVSHARNGEADLALALLDPLVEQLESPPARLLFNRGAIRLGQRHPGACQDLERATQRNEFLRRAWTYLGRCRESEGQLEAAIAAYRQALRLDPSEDGPTALLVSALRRVGRAAEADRFEIHARNQAEPSR